MGTWIEIDSNASDAIHTLVVPSWARGLKFPVFDDRDTEHAVVPSWARGLKCCDS